MIEILQVNVGTPTQLGQRRGQPVLSGIRKTPINGRSIDVLAENIRGDQQADLINHGGRDKAIFAYPKSHLDSWSDEFGTPDAFRPGNIGDNLTIGNLDERQVCIGDIWTWGEVELQICQPRIPCYKLAMTVGNPGIVKRFYETGFCGWYIRVLTPGTTSLDTPVVVNERDPAGITVRAAAMALFADTDNDRRIEIAGHPALARSWRGALERLITDDSEL